MEKTAVRRLGFLILSPVLAIAAVIWRPAARGNDEASIKRYIRREMGRQLGAMWSSCRWMISARTVLWCSTWKAENRTMCGSSGSGGSKRKL